MEKLVMKADEAAEVLNVGKSTVYDLCDPWNSSPDQEAARTPLPGSGRLCTGREGFFGLQSVSVPQFKVRADTDEATVGQNQGGSPGTDR